MSPEPTHLSPNHRDTLEKLFAHPVSHNVEWRDALALLRQVGEVTEQHDGKFRIKLGPELIFLPEPKAKDLNTDQVVTIRKLLESAGYEATSERIL